MQVQFFYNQSDDRAINKTLIQGATFEGQMRDECGIMAPTVRFQSQDVMRYNYCYIPEFRRYYSISSVNAFRDQFYDVSMTCDVLMSFRRDILQLYVIADKATDVENGDEYIDDSSLVTDNYMFSRVYNFPDGFLDNPQYILITAG